MNFLQRYEKTARKPNFTLKNQFSDATIEQTTDSKEDNQCGDNERPDVGDSRGDGHIVGMWNQAFTRELIVNHVAIYYAIASIDIIIRYS